MKQVPLLSSFVAVFFIDIRCFHFCSLNSNILIALYFCLLIQPLLIFFPAAASFNSSQQQLIVPLRSVRAQDQIPPICPSSSFSPNKLSFRRNISLTVTLQVGTPPQNVSMVLDTGSELSWLVCNQTQYYNYSTNRTTFDPTRSTSYSNISCSSPTCDTRTRDFIIPVSCDSDQLCHTTLSYADMSSAEGILASDVFRIGPSDRQGYDTVFGCMSSGFNSNPDEDASTTGLMGMNRGSLSFVSQMGFRKFSYCISGSDLSGLLLLGETNSTWLQAPLNYTPLVQISDPLPYFNRVAYTVQLEGIKVSNKMLSLTKSLLEPDHTGAGQTMVDSGTQFSYLLGPVYQALKAEFLNQTSGNLPVLDDPDFVFEGGMDLCYRVPINQTRLPELPSVTLIFHGAEMRVSGDPLLYRVPGEVRGNDAVYCFTFGNSDLLGVEAYLIGHHHQQNMWMEFDLLNSRIGLAQVQCDLAVHTLGLHV
ncbi:Glutathione gamma-glutamylcysteinyltransferase 1 [Dionaea muscipula]